MKYKYKCRNCGELLKVNRFFCNSWCQDQFVDRHIDLSTIDLLNSLASEKIIHVIAPQCKKCGEKCKVKLQKGTKKETYSIYCKKNFTREINNAIRDKEKRGYLELLY